ncbi:STAS domain-containing protein [Streptomyces sp. NPDC047014]|uniref:STAS domain-containing protein n=1 Tax=Streptomyces sp. NPDC047014 TaxID=3155736 RepID=UPI0033EECBDF
MTVRYDAHGRFVVSCAGEFDQETVGELAAACDRVDADAGLVVLDVKDVAFADSSFLNTLIQLRNTGPLVLQGPLPDQLHRLLSVTGALPLFEVRDAGAQAG